MSFGYPKKRNFRRFGSSMGKPANRLAARRIAFATSLSGLEMTNGSPKFTDWTTVRPSFGIVSQTSKPSWLAMNSGVQIGIGLNPVE